MELGRPYGLPWITGKPVQQKEGRLMAYRESDRLMVLRERESRLQGKGPAKLRSLQRKH